MDICFRYSSRVCSRIGFEIAIPALYQPSALVESKENSPALAMKTSIRPKSLTASDMAFWTCSGSDT